MARTSSAPAAPAAAGTPATSSSSVTGASPAAAPRVPSTRPPKVARQARATRRGPRRCVATRRPWALLLCTTKPLSRDPAPSRRARREAAWRRGEGSGALGCAHQPMAAVVLDHWLGVRRDRRTSDRTGLGTGPMCGSQQTDNNRHANATTGIVNNVTFARDREQYAGHSKQTVSEKIRRGCPGPGAAPSSPAEREGIEPSDGLTPSPH